MHARLAGMALCNIDSLHACRADLVEAHVPIEVLPCHRPRTGLEQEDHPEAHVLHNDIKGMCCMTMQHMKLKT